MQNPTLQMGVEVEMHGLSFTFKRTDPGHPNTFWPQPPAGTDADTTMIAHQPILVPESFANTQARADHRRCTALEINHGGPRDPRCALLGEVAAGGSVWGVPGCAEAVFYEAYKSLLMLTVPTTTERSNTLTIAKATSSSRGRAKFRRQMKKGQKKGVH